MSANDNDIIEAIRHLRISQIHRFSPSRAGISYAIPILSIIKILHTVLLCKLIMPCVLKRLFMISHIAVTYYSDPLAVKFVSKRYTSLCFPIQNGQRTND